MYGNLCRMSDEIGNALSNGSIRMALALWRTFYEHVVVGVFLMKQDSPDLFKKFADFSHRDVKKQKDSFDQHRELLKFPPIPTDHETAITNRTEELNTSYGKDFFAEYAWAKDALPLKTRASFYAVETQAEMSRYRPFYIWASNYIHPNFRAITDFRGDNDAIVLEKINQKVIDKQSFIDPMQLALVIFNIFNDYFLYRYSVNNQYSTNILVFRKLIERLQTKF
ncbi:MAG: hypothetical protein EOP45_16005 [Sphingobacteriaceae bacterium]|nr:MAG: hypothetical protein EOP45_16005 [Sphingobacteriaceae bacterium]